MLQRGQRLWKYAWMNAVEKALIHVQRRPLSVHKLMRN